MEVIRSEMRRIFLVALKIGLLIIGCILFLVIGRLIPADLVRENAEESYQRLEKEGAYFSPTAGVFFDNWTDAYYINNAATRSDDIFKGALANEYTESEEFSPDYNSPIEGIYCERK